MKNQNDLIISIVAGVLGIVFSLVFFFMKRDPVAPAAPQQVVTAPLVLPDATPVMGNSLPGGGSSSGSPFGGRGGMGGGMGMGGGSPYGPGGPMGGMSGPPGGGGKTKFGRPSASGS